LTQFSLTADSGDGIALQSDGKIIVIGSGTGVSLGQGQTVITKRRLNPTGTSDGTFASGFLGIGSAMLGTDAALQPDGRILLTGNSFSGHFHLARLVRTGVLIRLSEVATAPRIRL